MSGGDEDQRNSEIVRVLDYLKFAPIFSPQRQYSDWYADVMSWQILTPSLHFFALPSNFITPSPTTTVTVVISDTPAPSSRRGFWPKSGKAKLSELYFDCPISLGLTEGNIEDIPIENIYTSFHNLWLKFVEAIRLKANMVRKQTKTPVSPLTCGIEFVSQNPLVPPQRPFQCFIELTPEHDDRAQDLFLEEELASLLSKEEENHLYKNIQTDPSLGAARREAVDYILKINAHHSFSALTAILAVNYLDRFLWSFSFQTNKPWMTHLLAVACLSLAAKIEETQVPHLLDLQQVKAMYVFEAKTIQRMELLVLSTLQWKMNPVTPLSFLDHITRRLCLKNQLCLEFLKRCECLIMCLISDSRFMCYLPSVLASATMLQVINTLGLIEGKMEDFPIENIWALLHAHGPWIEFVEATRLKGNMFRKNTTLEFSPIGELELMELPIEHDLAELQCTQTPQPARSPTQPEACPNGGEIMQLDPSEQPLSSIELDATHLGGKVVIADKSFATISESEKKTTIKTILGESRTGPAISFEDLQPHFGRKRLDVAKDFGVSVSTFKRICRQHGITEWRFRKVNNKWIFFNVEPVTDHVRGTEGPFATSPRTGVVGSIISMGGQVEMGNQMKGCSLEEEIFIETSNPSLDEKLDLKLQCTQTPQPARSPTQLEAFPNGGEIMQLDSSVQPLSSMELDATNLEGKVIIPDKSFAAISESEKKTTIKTIVRESRRTGPAISFEDLRPHFGRKRVDVAKDFGVSVSTFKRICSQHGITEWRFRKVNNKWIFFNVEPVTDHVRGTEGPFATSPRTGVVGSIISMGGQVEMGNQMKGCSLEEEIFIETSNPSLDEKLDLKLQCTQTPQPARSPTQLEAFPNGGEIMQLDSSVQPLSSMELDATNLEGKVIIPDKSFAAISESEKKTTIKTIVRESRRTGPAISFEDLRPHFGRKRVDVAKDFGGKPLYVSVSTFKRICSQHGITKWRFRKVNNKWILFNLKLVTDHVQGTEGSFATRPRTGVVGSIISMGGQVEIGNQMFENNIPTLEGHLVQNMFLPDFGEGSKRLKTMNASNEERRDTATSQRALGVMQTFSDPTAQTTATEDARIVSVKAIYGEDMVKFQYSLTSGFNELKEQLAKKLELELGNFIVKYKDEDQDWILITCDADFQEFVEFSSSLSNQPIRLSVTDKVASSGKSCKSGRGLKRNRSSEI